ncbi:hypothetical protein DEO72_LG1g2440 [Vigna unguiculata]|uniref:Uncharacterized protein n=1 Tax=Vigna unguiculata TaxID=3917 RepID=A0A4D6KY87_VIGUN|nr:hypothetical protein DEO72_LG1g2440 [Vigna unguiculata]
MKLLLKKSCRPCLEPQPSFTSARVPTFFRFTFHLGHSSAHLASRVLELRCPLFQCGGPMQTHFQLLDLELCVASVTMNQISLTTSPYLESLPGYTDGAPPWTPTNRGHGITSRPLTRSPEACNSLESLGETFGATLQWSGRNSMAPVSGCPWWCPICITSSRSSSSGSSRGIHHKCKHPLNPTKLYVSG